jgi:steroid 5-alpha reductase family enzyme
MTMPAIMLIILALALCGVMALAWFVAGRTRRSGWIDAIWSYAVGAGGVVTSLLPLGSSGGIDARQWLVVGLAALWSLRLGSHIVARTLRGGDDPRYRQLREEWGGRFRNRLFWFLQIQSAAAFLLVVSILTAAHRPGAGLSYGDLLGTIIFAIALIGEAVADRQLARFSTDPKNKGKVCDTGLWAFSRHPNYFFEWLVWVAFAAIAIGDGS